jgi:hypothetical protein
MPRLCGGLRYLFYSTFEDNAPRYSRILLSPYSGGETKVVLTTDKLYGTQAAAGICTVEFHESATERSIHELDPRAGRLRELFRVKNTGSATVPLQGGQRFMNFNLSRREMDLLDRSGTRIRSFPLPLLPGELVSAIDPEFNGGGAYLSTRLSPAGTRVLRVSLEGVVTEVFRSSVHGTGYALSSPDGQRIAFYLRTIDSNLSLLEGL